MQTIGGKGLSSNSRCPRKGHQSEVFDHDVTTGRHFEWQIEMVCGGANIGLLDARFFNPGVQEALASLELGNRANQEGGR